MEGNENIKEVKVELWGEEWTLIGIPVKTDSNLPPIIEAYNYILKDQGVEIREKKYTNE